MSNALADLISQPEAVVARALKRIEDSNGNPSEDSRLLAENIQLLRDKVGDLGLDPDDTTGEELHEALKAKFKRDSAQLDKALGIGPKSGVEKTAAVAARLAAAAGLPEAWALKPGAIKSLFRKNPPKKLLKQLSYRSLASFIKHEDMEAAYAAAMQVEAKTWRNNIAKTLNKVIASNYEMRPMKILILPSASAKLFSVNNEVGSLALSSGLLPKDIQVLSLAVMMISEIEALPDSGVVNIAKLNPALRWWADNDCLLLRGQDGPVSLNLKDLSRDILTNTSYRQRSTHQASRCLLANLFKRYEIHTQTITDSFKEIGYIIDDNITGSPGLPLGKRLALEYAQAE